MISSRLNPYARRVCQMLSSELQDAQVRQVVRYERRLFPKSSGGIRHVEVDQTSEPLVTKKLCGKRCPTICNADEMNLIQRSNSARPERMPRQLGEIQLRMSIQQQAAQVREPSCQFAKAVVVRLLVVVRSKNRSEAPEIHNSYHRRS